jgi:hypothetical protein
MMDVMGVTGRSKLRLSLSQPKPLVLVGTSKVVWRHDHRMRRLTAEAPIGNWGAEWLAGNSHGFRAAPPQAYYYYLPCLTLPYFT